MPYVSRTFKGKKIWFILLLWTVLVCSTSLGNKPTKLAIFPDLVNPQSIRMDQNQIYITDGARICIYSRENYFLSKLFGRPGESHEEFRPRSGTGMRLFVNVQTDDMIISSHERVSVFSKRGEFRKLLDAPYMADFVIPFGNKFIVSAYYIHVGTGKSTQHLLLCDKKFDSYKEIAGSHLGGGSAKGFGGPDRKLHTDLVPEYFGFKVDKNLIYVGHSKKGFFFEVFDHEGKKLNKIDRDYEKQRVTAEFRTKRMKEIQKKSFFQRYKDHVVIDEVEFFPAFSDFSVSGEKIFVYTYLEQQGKQEIVILDLKGELLNRVFVPKADVSFINEGKYFYLDKNEDGEWELLLQELESRADIIKEGSGV